jgi:uncharacterized membrane protein YtjA (UPF0391 family)
MAGVFISYRRGEGGAWAGRLYDRLSQHFGRENIFMDIDTIEPGLDFVEVIERAVASCDILIALIGRQWLTITDPSGQRRLDNPEDFVRLEIATALKRNIRVIPALIQGASMPRSTDLPEELRMLTRRNALEISDTHFHRDVDQLIEILDRALGRRVSRRRLGEIRDAGPASSRRGASQLIWGIVFFIIALVAGLFGYGGIASVAAGLAQILFFLFIIISVFLLTVGLVTRRRR